MKRKVIISTLLCLLLFSTSDAQTWATLDAVDSLIVSESLFGIASIYGNDSRVFISSLKADFSTGLYYSDDGGGSWNESTTNDNSGSYLLFSRNSKLELFSWGTSLLGSRHIKKSLDNGSSWEITVPDNANIPVFFQGAFFSTISDTMVLTSTARSVGVLKSVDGGINWITFDSFSDGDGNKAIRSLFSYGNNFYLLAGTNGEGLFKSHKDSSNWTKVYPEEGVGKSLDLALVTKEGRIIIAHSSGLDYSDDEGMTWTEKSREELGIGSSGTIARMANFNGEVLLSVQDGGEAGSRLLLVNKDISGTTNISEGLLEYSRGTEFNFIATTNTQIFGNRLGETKKLWSYGESPTGTPNELESEPEVFRLSQNYPNPFNPTTNISFNLPSTNNVDLKVYNLLGQEVATLINGRLNSGNHTIKFDASRLASGVYIYRLISGDYSQTKKMMLIK